MAEHTPAPWAVYGKLVPDAKEDVGGWRCVRRVLNPKREPNIMPLYGDCFAMVENGEDARLIAAAPELLAALKAVTSCPQAVPWLAQLPVDYTNAWAMAMFAIAKAEGK
jgi:hypothetical protein